MRTVIVYSRDNELAEIAALGIRVTAGWKAVIATKPEMVGETAERQPVYAILSIALDSNFDVLTDLLQVNSTGSAHSVPVVVVTPEPFLYQQLLSLGVLPICTPFDPLALSSLITQALTSFPLEVALLSNIARA